MTLTVGLGELFALVAGGTIGAVGMAVLASRRLAESRGRAEMEALRAEGYCTRLVDQKDHHADILELSNEIRAHIKKRENDARELALLRKAFLDQVNMEVRELRKLLAELPQLKEEVEEWTAFGNELQPWLANTTFAADTVAERADELLRKLTALLLGRELRERAPEFTAIEDVASDQEAGQEETRELAAVS